jgi:hypothetical protein
MHAALAADHPPLGIVLRGPYAMDPPPPHEPVRPAAEQPADLETNNAIRELLAVLPPDVLAELQRGEIDRSDPAFLDGLMDHVARLSQADPRFGQRILGKVIRLRKRIARDVRASDPEAVVSATVTRSKERVGRNAPCPCGSGRKYKQCCLRKG